MVSFKKNPDGEIEKPATKKRIFNINGVEFTMVYVEGGTFMMGGDDAEVYEEERPVHEVTLSDYYIGETEVTQKLWKAVMGSNPAKIKGKNFPVECVGWNDCQEFISKLNEITGENFSLPTEAQWEFAARGGNYSKGYKYSGSDNLDAVAWYYGQLDRIGYRVGKKKPNELGIYDMSGNVMEWCSDWYGDYSSDAVIDPIGPSFGSGRVIRGGCLMSIAAFCRCTTRMYLEATNGHGTLGLRLALK